MAVDGSLFMPRRSVIAGHQHSFFFLLPRFSGFPTFSNPIWGMAADAC